MGAFERAGLVELRVGQVEFFDRVAEMVETAGGDGVHPLGHVEPVGPGDVVEAAAEFGLHHASVPAAAAKVGRAGLQHRDREARLGKCQCRVAA